MNEYKITMELAPDEIEALKSALLVYSEKKLQRVMDLQGIADQVPRGRCRDEFTEKMVREHRRLYAADSAFDKLRDAINEQLPADVARIMRVI